MSPGGLLSTLTRICIELFVNSNPEESTIDPGSPQKLLTFHHRVSLKICERI